MAWGIGEILLEVMQHGVRPDKAGMSSRRQETTVIKATSHEATMTDGRDNQPSGARRKTIIRMASARSGCNESERRGSLDSIWNREPSPYCVGEGSMWKQDWQMHFHRTAGC